MKALYVARATGKPALADDSGMCVTALNGDPGVYTADWAEREKGAPRDWDHAMQKVHDLLGDNPDKSAAFVACLVLAWPDGHCESVEARMEGSVVWPPRGSRRFGYDPVFMPAGHDIVYAEMDDKTKNTVSHRAIAFRMMMEKCF
jgi:XTP/dITP diphosphohydrolase